MVLRGGVDPSGVVVAKESMVGKVQLGHAAVAFVDGLEKIVQDVERFLDGEPALKAEVGDKGGIKRINQ